MLFLGYDPGGKEANGAAILTANNDVRSLQTANLDSVDETLSWFTDKSNSLNAAP
jgi:hypothetical protein